MGRFRLVVAVLLALFGVPARADTVSVSDSFDGPALDSAWTVEFDAWGWGGASAGWTYHFASGGLHVTEIKDGGGVDEWSSVQMSRPLTTAGDFAFDLDLGWASTSGDSDLKSLYFSVYSSSNLVARVAYGDAWIGNSGKYFAYAIGEGVGYETAVGSVPHAGTNTFGLSRSGGTLSLTVGGTEVLTGTNSEPAVRLGIEFKYFPGEGGTFDRLSVYDLSGSYSVVPLPPAVWIAAAMLAVLGVTYVVRRGRGAAGRT